MPPDAQDTRPRILLVTGMSGAGKTTALRVLEDLGWEAIDNFPVRLLKRLVGPEDKQGGNEAVRFAIGFDSRTRGFDPNAIIARIKDLAASGRYLINTLFLDCAGEELERRYNETRRPHPMSQGMPVAAGIAAERELLAPLRRWADSVIVTTGFSSSQLQQAIREQFSLGGASEMTVTVTSFGFARGMPPVADLLFDMRYLDNPHWDPQLREGTGLDAPVGDFIRQDPAWEESITRIRDLLLCLLPRYQLRGKAYVHIAFGCTGGRHRSVFAAEQIAGALRDNGFSPTVLHRNLGSRAAEMIEGPHQP